MPPQLHFQDASVVLRGQFSPLIFSPLWLAGKNLIRVEEADAADIELIHPKASIFSTEWLRVQVLESKFQVETPQVPYFEVLRDLALGVLKLLVETPVKQLGLNFTFRYELHSEDEWHSLGDRLVPKEEWSRILGNPGMETLVVRGMLKSEHQGHLRIRVEPTTQVKNGLFIEVNNHYELQRDSESDSGTREAIEILSSDWSDVQKHSITIADALSKPVTR